MKHFPNFKVILVFIISMYSLATISALGIGVTKASFQHENNKYIEVYLQVIGETVVFNVMSDSILQASVDFTLLIKDGEKIVSYDKFSLKSHLSTFKEDFIGIRRIKVENGNYTLHIEAVDSNNPTDKFLYREDFKIDLDAENICISDLRLLADVKKSADINNPFVKNGYYLEPVLSYFLPKKIELMGVYFEVYNTENMEGKSKIKLSIKNGYKGTGQKVVFRRNFDIKKGKLTPILTKIDINGLSSGNYHVLLELIDKDNKNIYTKFVNFQRSNPIANSAAIVDRNSYENSFVKKLSPDSVIYSLKAMVPITTADNSVAINDIISKKKIEEGKYFIWRYWLAKNKLSPRNAYDEYMKYAIAVDRKFKAQVGYGFETDRGYIYLKYGMPSQVITQESEPTAPPYEMWYFDRIEQGDQRNIKFIFYIPSLAHNDFELLHSNCIGEKNNPTWFYKLYSKRNDSNARNVQPTQIQEFYDKLKNSFDNNAVRIWEELK